MDVGVRGDDVLAKKHHVYERDRRLRCEDEKTNVHIEFDPGMLRKDFWYAA